MGDTKERILAEALRLFARDGYEAVSVSAIAGALGITKGALYRHYRDKRAIFECILEHMELLDAQNAAAHDVPEGALEEMPDAYRQATVDDIVDYAKTMFRYWTEDEFAASFRRMLTLEQYRSAEISRLYQQYLAAGPLGYMADLFAEMGFRQPRREAEAFYGAMFLYYAVYDGAEDKESARAALDDWLEAERRRLKGED